MHKICFLQDTEMVAPVMSKWLPISPADMAPDFSSVRISRRTGSANALNVWPKLNKHSSLVIIFRNISKYLMTLYGYVFIYLHFY